jgi:HK97 gp10 family phage protein
MAFRLPSTGSLIRKSKFGSVSSTRGVTGLKGGQVFGNFQVLGVPEAIRKFQLVGSVAGRESGLIAFRGAKRVEAEAKQNVHSSTNTYAEDYEYTDALRDSIKATKFGPYDWEVASYVKYAAYEELGTSKNPAHPFLRPALYAEVPKAQAELHILARTLESL